MSSDQTSSDHSKPSTGDRPGFEPGDLAEAPGGPAVWSALTASAAAATIGAVIILCRLGLEDLWVREAALSVGFAWMVFNLPLLVGRDGPLDPGPRTAAVLLVGLAGGFWLGPGAGLVCALLGVSSLALVLARREGEGAPRVRTLALAGLAMGVLLTSITLGRGYLTPTTDVGLEAIGNTHVDSVFHMSIAGMLRSYEVPSTGLDGLPWLGYHWGSHAAMAALAEGQGTSVVTSYCTAYPIVFTTLFAHALILAAAASARARRRRGIGHGRDRQRWWTAWLVVMVAIGGFLPSPIGHLAGLKPSFLISESMGVGLTLAFLCMGAILPWLQWGARRGWFQALLLPIAIGLWGISKISLLVLAGPTIAWLVARRPGWLIRPVPLASLGLTLAMALYINSLRWAPEEAASLEPLHFLRAYVEVPFWPIFFPVSLAWAGLACWLRCCELGVTSPARLRARLRKGRLLDLEVLFIVAIIGFAISMSVVIAGGSGLYFHTVQQWLSVIIVVSVCLRLGPGLSRRTPATKDNSRGGDGARRERRQRRVIQALTVILVFNTGRDLVRMGKDVAADRRSVPVSTGTETGHQRSRAAVTACLRHLYEVTPRAERRRSVVYVPPGLEAYWSSTPKQPRAAPFSGPVLTEMAMLQGQPRPVPGVDWINYGFQLYDVDSNRPSLSRERAMDLALKMGFQRVYWIEGRPEGCVAFELRPTDASPLLMGGEFLVAWDHHND